MSLLSKFIDDNTHDLQKLGGGGGKGAPGGSGGDPFGIRLDIPENFSLNLDQFNTDQSLNLDQDFGIPDILETAGNITKIDLVETVDNVLTEVTKFPKVIGDAEPVIGNILGSVAETVVNVTKIPEEIGKIDAVKVVEDVVAEGVHFVNQVPQDIVTIAEEAVLKPASNVIGELSTATKLFIKNITDPFQPGSTEGTAAPQLTEADTTPVKTTIGDPGVIQDIETTTAKAGQMTEEERLRRIRRLMLNRYGREDTILGGGNDTKSRRRYAV